MRVTTDVCTTVATKTCMMIDWVRMEHTVRTVHLQWSQSIMDRWLFVYWLVRLASLQSPPEVYLWKTENDVTTLGSRSFEEAPIQSTTQSNSTTRLHMDRRRAIRSLFLLLMVGRSSSWRSFRLKKAPCSFSDPMLPDSGRKERKGRSRLC